MLREKELLAAGVGVGPLRRITVVLGRAGGGKWHVPAKAAGWRSHCRYAQHLTGSPLALLDVCERVCPCGERGAGRGGAVAGSGRRCGG